MRRIAELIFAVLIVSWILTHANEFSTAVRALGNVFQGSVAALGPKK